MTLDLMRPGEEAVISGYHNDVEDEALRLLEMGLIIGSVVRFIKKAPFGDPIQIRIRGFDLSLRRNLARSIIATPIR
ncbi:MAG: ferrous iron transport protein A [Deferribacteres bacterium]|nr:ferrous iron transport protein A [candidate division KSB1 bacterium]MCB9508595.1 ferrous iron transport protein A [Deferribacteres bacterium]